MGGYELRAQLTSPKSPCALVISASLTIFPKSTNSSQCPLGTDSLSAIIPSCPLLHPVLLLGASGSVPGRDRPSCSVLGPASPGQALEELAHGHEVELVRAVEHHCLDGQGLAQVFGGLSFPCASWASWGAPKLEVQGPSQSQVAPAGVRRGRHEPRSHLRIPRDIGRESLPVLGLMDGGSCFSLCQGPACAQPWLPGSGLEPSATCPVLPPPCPMALQSFAQGPARMADL